MSRFYIATIAATVMVFATQAAHAEASQAASCGAIAEFVQVVGEGRDLGVSERDQLAANVKAADTVQNLNTLNDLTHMVYVTKATPKQITTAFYTGCMQ
ncbi:hypothetical protein [Paraburkholderia sp. 32]|uniref:hypothetical protein n=1 Tax=Paraburkholderia sp. 32 TaxID=2991057 RepID=UPI003D232392